MVDTGITSIDHFIKTQRVIKVSGKYIGLIATIVRVYPKWGTLTTHIKVSITKDEMNKFEKNYHPAIGRFVKQKHEVGNWRPSLMYETVNNIGG